MVALGEKVEDVVSRRVEGKGHQECVEKVEAVVTDFDKTLQQALQRTTVHLQV